jgi:hypothetical protein
MPGLDGSGAGANYLFSTSTTAADPGLGNFGFNNATLSAATQLFISETTQPGNLIDAFIGAWDDSTNPIRGTLVFLSATVSSHFVVFNVTGTVTDNGAWDTVGVTWVQGIGGFAAGERVQVFFSRTGDKGSAGAGSGDMLAANNLNDVADKPTSRTNLGIGLTSTPQFTQVLLSGAVSSPTNAATKAYADGLLAFTPAGNIAATNVQAAIAELDTEKVAKAGDTVTGALTLSAATDILTIATPATPASGRARLFAGTAKGLDALGWMNTLGVPLVITRDRVFYAKNSTGGTLTKGTPVYISGATGGAPLIAKAQADATMTKAPCVGLVFADIANNATGAVMTGGVLAMNTSAFVDGAKLYVSATTAGTLTSTMPAHPNITQGVGVVEVSGVGTGSLLVSCIAVNPHEYDGVNGTSWAVGDGTGTTKSYLVKNAAGIGTLAWTPTTNRTLTLPDVTGTVAVTGDISSYAAPNANVLVNGDFRVNQVGYVSAAALAAGSYGHDQWKAGAAGGDYSFTQLKSSTQITIASGKSLIQPIEDANVSGGSYILTWTGTAQARAGVNTLTPSGAYAASPLPIAGQTAGTAMSIEFNAGTLNTVKLERGSTQTPFVMRPYDQELLTCQRYFRWLGFNHQFYAYAAENSAATIAIAPIMRAAPTISGLVADPNLAATNGNNASMGFNMVTPYSMQMYLSSSAAGVCFVQGYRVSADARL